MKRIFKLFPIFIFLYFNIAVAQKQIVEKDTLENNVTCRNIPFQELNNMKEFGISKETILQYCELINENIHGVYGFDLIQDDSNANDKQNQISNFLEWEDKKDNEMMYQTSKFFSFPLTTYWDKKNVCQEDLEKIYIANRALLLASENDIRMIKQISENVFEVQLAYCFMTKKNKTPQIVFSKLIFEFEFGKIKSIYPIK
jgi:hypothetical protein